MATSPPAPPYASLPVTNTKKRPSLGPSVSTSNAAKRPKLHPLRQTSFPNADAMPFSATPSARSETGSLTGSLVSGISSKAGEKRARGRPRKDAPQPATTQMNGTPSLDGTAAESGGAGDGADDTGTLFSARGARSIVSGRSGAADIDDEAEDEGEWGREAQDLDAADKQRLQDEIDEENNRLERLLSVLSPEQDFRFQQYRRAKFNTGNLKRIVNSIVSQSVTQSPLIAINAYTKFFVCELISRACDVQREWAKAFDEKKTFDKEEKIRREEEKAKQEDDELPVEERERRKAGREMERAMRRVVDYIPNPHKGGLLPDHLREALRRYKTDGEGAGVGFGGISLPMLGTQGPGTWRVGAGMGGRRLFR